MSAPDKVLIPCDDDRFEHVGRQFMAFGVGAYPGPTHFYGGKDWKDVKRWMTVLHMFDADGNHLSTEANLAGFDREAPAVYDKADQMLDALLAEDRLKDAEWGDIEVKLFSVVIDEVYYELVYESEMDGEIEHESATLWPNDCVFYPPWNTGNYDT